MNQNKLRRVLTTISLLYIIVSLTIPVRADEECNFIATLQSPEPSSDAQFGYSVAINGDYLIIGEFIGQVDEKGAGKAYIYDIDGNLLTTFLSPVPRSSFSHSVSVSGDTVVVGEYASYVQGERERGMRAAGRAYILDSDGNLQSTLQSPTPEGRANFGWSVAVSGDTIVVSEPKSSEDMFDAGRAYIYDANGDLQLTLPSPTPGLNGYFGLTLAADGDDVVVSEVYGLDMANPVGPGSVYIFDPDGTLKTTLKSPEQNLSINFGCSVAISEDIVVVGASYDEVDGINKAGRAYIFNTDGNLLTSLQAPSPEENAEFGNAVAISGETVVVGEYKADEEEFNEGRAYVFDLNGDLISSLRSSIPSVVAGFGHSVAVSGDTILIGEPSAKVDGVTKAGRVHIYGLGEPVIEQPLAVEKTIVTESESESEKNSGIPGFPYESIVLSLILTSLVLWLTQRQR